MYTRQASQFKMTMNKSSIDNNIRIAGIFYKLFHIYTQANICYIHKPKPWTPCMQMLQLTNVRMIYI